MVLLRILVSLLRVFFFYPLIRWSSTSDVLARPVDFCWSWASRPTEFLCLTQKGNNLDQQKNLEDQPVQEQC